MLECKTAKVDVIRPHVYEAAKYREAFGAQYCTIIGPAFAKDEEFDSELQTHQVSAWTVDDLAALLQMHANPYEMRDLFAPGVVSDRIMDVAWRRGHGEAKRVHITAQIIAESGWQTQCAAAHGGSPANAPLLTEDAAMLMVDTALAAQGCHVNCSRDDVRAAFSWLTSPLVARAVWADEGHVAIAVTGAGFAPASMAKLP